MRMQLAIGCLLMAELISTGFAADQSVPALASGGWSPAAPRDEIRPEFALEPHAGLNDTDCLVIRADAREGLDGAWTRIFPVTGGKYYRFTAWYQAKSVALPRRSVVAKLDWSDTKSQPVPLDEPTVANYLRG